MRNMESTLESDRPQPSYTPRPIDMENDDGQTQYEQKLFPAHWIGSQKQCLCVPMQAFDASDRSSSIVRDFLLSYIAGISLLGRY